MVENGFAIMKQRQRPMIELDRHIFLVIIQAVFNFTKFEFVQILYNNAPKRLERFYINSHLFPLSKNLNNSKIYKIVHLQSSY